MRNLSNSVLFRNNCIFRFPRFFGKWWAGFILRKMAMNPL
jgi:hypothetical protein